MRTANQPNERLTPNQVAKRLNVHVATIYRWTLKGVRGRRLRSFLIGADDTSRYLIWIGFFSRRIMPYLTTIHSGQSGCRKDSEVLASRFKSVNTVRHDFHHGCTLQFTRFARAA